MGPRVQTPEAEHRFAVTLWAVTLFTLAMYYLVIRMVQPEQATENPALVRILLVFSMTCAMASFVAKRVLASRARSENKPAFRRTGLVVALVLSEASALLGLIVWFATGAPQYYIFLLTGAAATVLHYPARAKEA